MVDSTNLLIASSSPLLEALIRLMSLACGFAIHPIKTVSITLRHSLNLPTSELRFLRCGLTRRLCLTQRFGTMNISLR